MAYDTFPNYRRWILPHEDSSRCWCRPAVLQLGDSAVTVHVAKGETMPDDVTMHDACQDALDGADLRPEVLR